MAAGRGDKALISSPARELGLTRAPSARRYGCGRCAIAGDHLIALALGPMPWQDVWSPLVRLRRSPPTLPRWTPRPPNLLWVERRWRAGQAGRVLPAPSYRSGPSTGVREERLFEGVAWRSPLAWMQLSATADRTSIPPGWAYLWGGRVDDTAGLRSLGRLLRAIVGSQDCRFWRGMGLIRSTLRQMPAELAVRHMPSTAPTHARLVKDHQSIG